jgi:hypothetical protein
MKKLTRFTAALVLTIFPFCASCEKTVVSKNFDPIRFRGVTAGTTLQNVVRELGPPLRIVKCSSNPQNTPRPSGSSSEIVTLPEAYQLVQDTNVYLILHYSLQGDARKDYHRYDISVQGGKVVAKLDEVVWE